MTKGSAEDKRKHLEMIQAVISRMGSNSFLFKGWSITIIAAVSAFASKDSDHKLMLIPVVSTLLFWAIDAYYLMNERAFRKLYEKVAATDPKDIDFAMNPAKEYIGFRNWLKTLKTTILSLFYGVVLILLIFLIFSINNISLEVLIHYGA